MSERPTWTNKYGRTDYIADMSTNHIKRCISFIQGKWKELQEYTDYITADGEGLTGVLVVPGKDHFGPKLRDLKKELKKRQTPTMEGEF